MKCLQMDQEPAMGWRVLDLNDKSVSHMQETEEDRQY